MIAKKAMDKREGGFSFPELAIVLMGAMIILAAAVPVVNTSMNTYRLVLTAQSIAAQLQFARMKAVSSNETFRVNFPAGQTTYSVETSDGTVVAGPFFLPNSISWNSADTGSAITFPGNFVSFTPTGAIPVTGNGSLGRVKLGSPTGYKIDIVVGTGGVIRQTPAFRGTTPPF